MSQAFDVLTKQYKYQSLAELLCVCTLNTVSGQYTMALFTALQLHIVCNYR